MYASDRELNGDADRNPADVAFPGLNRRSGESLRSEAAFAKIAGKQRTKAERLKYAAVLLGVLERHDISRSRFAMMIDLNEKTVRKMLTAEVSIPQHIVERMPTEMRRDYVDGVNAAAGYSPTMGIDRELARVVAAGDLEAAHALEDRVREAVRRMGRTR